MHFSLPVAFALDSLIAGLVVGPLLPSRRERVRLALAFGGCDAAATLLSSARTFPLLAPPSWRVYLLCVFVVACAVRRNRKLVWLLPVLLSADNLFAGALDGTALELGAGSAAMALVGLSLSALGRRIFLAHPAEV
jgi:hypothetical protein